MSGVGQLCQWRELRRGQGRATGRTTRSSSSRSTAIVGLLLSLGLAACASAKAPPPAAPLPRQAYAHYLAGKAAAFDDESATAAAHLRAAMAAAPDEPALSVALIAALAEAAALPAAHLEARRALARWPLRPEVWRAVGELLLASGKSPVAARAFRRAIALDPRDEDAHIGLISALQRDAPDSAATEAAVFAAVRQLIARQPDSVAGHYLLGQLLINREQRDAAIAELRTVLRLSPGHLDARLLLADELHQAGRTAEAIAEARSAFDRSGEDLSFVEPLLRLLCAAGDRRAALDLLGLYDDDERALAELVAVARLGLQLGELPLAHRLAGRALDAALAAGAAEAASAAEAKPPDDALGQATALVAEVFRARLAAWSSLPPSSLPSSSSSSSLRCALAQ